MKKGFKIIDSLQITSNFSSLTEVENLVDRVCVNLGVEEDSYGNVLIAVTEAVNNAIQHGNEFDTRLFVDVAVGDQPQEFCFNVKDEGRGFDYTNLPDPTAPENILKENGRGIFLMKSLSDNVEFEESGSSVSLYFNK
ncbi:MAG: ATP-binding protein [Bacteroidetes bacterium]|nr:ATP-binding protein [Bacteroidota bacterium]